ncbi:phBC6A51 family helix-turn-helix protein [Priestia aryabhattai]|uniref:phBC6A51 family helix-turn-helix protein n=1 Tax=Priestia aryabhattai TaxID=412384 RepID=UPI0035ABB6A6
MEKGSYKTLTPKDIDEMTEIYQRQFKGETIVSICKDMGIDRRTYYRRRENPQWKRYEDQLNERLIDNAYYEIMNTIILKAKQGSSPHAKLNLDATGRLKSTKEVRREQEENRLNGSTNPLDIQELKRMVEEDRKLRRIK